MKRSLVRLFLALLPLGAWVDVACAQITSVAAPSGTLQMGGISIASGTAVLMPVDLYGHPIAVTTSAGLSIPGSPARPVGYSCTITSGGMNTCNVPDEVAASPSGFRYDITIADSASGKAFTLRQVPGITGTAFRLDQYAPTVTVPVAAAMTRTDGSGAPSGACVAPAEYFDKTGHALYECVNGAWVSVTGSGGSGESVITGIRFGNGSNADTVANSSQVQTAIGSGVYDASGAAAAATASALQKTGNLSDLANTATARTNLGLAHINENTPGVETVTQPITVNDGSGSGLFWNATEGDCSGVSPLAGVDKFCADSVTHTTLYSPNGAAFQSLNTSGAWRNITGLLTFSGCTQAGGACTAASNTADITVSSIPTTYNALRVYCMINTTDAGGTSIAAQFNADTGLHYSWQQFYSFDTGVYAAGSSSTVLIDHVDFGPAPGSPGGSNSGSFDLLIPFYASSAFNKSINSSGNRWLSSSQHIIQNYTGRWESTAAITSIKMYSEIGGNIAAGSTCAFYGVQ